MIVLFIFRFIAFFFILFSGISLLFCLNLLPLHKDKKLLITTKIIPPYCRVLLKTFRVKVDFVGFEDFERGKNGLIVCNHLSYLDIVVIYSFMPSIFITSFDIKRFALPGFLARLVGSLFINRKDVSGIKKEIRSIATTLEKGFTVVLFPESTSTDGEAILPFKSPLMKSAIDAEKPVIPLCIKYRKINNNPITAESRDLIFWYGNMGFFSHFFKFMSVSSIQVELVALGTIEPGSYSSRKELSDEAYKRISDCYQDARVLPR